MRKIPFPELVAELHKIARVTVVPSYAELRAALVRGDTNVWEFSETLTLAAVVKDWGTEKQRQRLREEILASRWCTEIMRDED